MRAPICSTGLRWLWLTIVIIIADLGIKQLVLKDLNLYEPHAVMPFFNIMYAQNFGAAFSFWLMKVAGNVGSLLELRLVFLLF